MLSRIFLCLILFVISSCSSLDKKADTPEGAFAIAQEFDKDERFEEAIKRYGEVKNKFPYSQYATMAELAIADVYFKQESFAEAQITYQSFKDLHPKHPQIDYVTFQIAMSFFKQLPTTIDRDLSLAHDAIREFDTLIKDYPKSNHYQEAATNREKSIKMLMQKEEYIADFYFIRKKYQSALKRYEGILQKYKNLGLDAKALARASLSAEWIHEKQKSESYRARLFQEFPNSDEARNFGKEAP